MNFIKLVLSFVIILLSVNFITHGKFSFTPEAKAESSFSKKFERKHSRRIAEMRDIDTNADNILDAQEIENGIISRFQRADANFDSELSEDEQRIVFQVYQEQHKDLHPTQKRLADKMRKYHTRFNKIDKNNDEVISLKEYKSYYTRRYAKLDKNKDGMLSVKEYRTQIEKTNQPDKKD